MIKLDDIFKIGRFYKPHGICGEINFSFTDDIFDRTESPYWVVEIDGIFVPFFVESYRFRGETTALVKIEDINDEQAAKLLADHDVYYPKAYADKNDDFIGEVVAVDDTTMNVLFQLKMASDGSLRLLPAAEDFMLRIDTKQRCLYMDIPEGLLDLD